MHRRIFEQLIQGVFQYIFDKSEILQKEMVSKSKLKPTKSNINAA